MSTLPSVPITTNDDLTTTWHDLLAYLSAAERGGILELPDISDVASLPKTLQSLVTSYPKIIPFIAQVGLAIGWVPIISDFALASLPAKIKDEVTRARAVQHLRNSAGLNLTPAIALIIAQANSDAGAANFALDDTPLGTPLGPPVAGAPWTHS